VRLFVKHRGVHVLNGNEKSMSTPKKEKKKKGT